VQPGPGYVAPVVVSASLSGNPSTAAGVPFGSVTHPYDNAPSNYPQGGSQDPTVLRLRRARTAVWRFSMSVRR